MGVTDATGKFTLSTGAENGAAVGNIRVSVVVPSKSESGGGPAANIDPNDPTSVTRAMQAVAEQRREQGPGGGQPKPAEETSILPAKYGNPETSGLAYEIKSGQDNVLTIELK